MSVLIGNTDIQSVNEMNRLITNLFKIVSTPKKETEQKLRRLVGKSDMQSKNEINGIMSNLVNTVPVS